MEKSEIGIYMKKKKVKKKEKEKAPAAPEGMPSQGDGKTFDFGGIPDRDLKKNLGCG